MINAYSKPTHLSHSQYLWFLLLSYSMIVAISNWYNARLVSLFGMILSPGALSFPISFLLSDIITEVYGYKNARRAIWSALFFNLLFLAFGQLVINLPSPAIATENNAAFHQLLSLNAWIVCGSFSSYLIAEPLNSYLIAKLKIKFNGQYLGIRFITSTFLASFMDSIVFTLIAYHTLVNLGGLISMSLNAWWVKSTVEIIGLPFSVRLAKWLKRTEALDIYDSNTDFNPFKLDTQYERYNNKFFT